MRRLLRVLFVAVALSIVAVYAVPALSQSAPSPSPSPVAYDPAALPSGPLGDSIRLGHDIIDNPQKYLKANVTSGMSCSACHIGVGTVKNGGTFVGTYARFPQWNKRSNRVIALQDRLAECFLYSMNGTPPAYSSKAMIAMTSYIAYLSRNVPVGSKADADSGIIIPLPSASPNIANGKALFMQNCATCHGSNGAGIAGAIPPLWGPTSFNSGAGMAHIDRMTGFVFYNMPANAPRSLSAAQAYDISAYVLSHERPKFNPKRMIQWAAQRADSF